MARSQKLLTVTLLLAISLDTLPRFRFCFVLSTKASHSSLSRVRVSTSVGPDVLSEESAYIQRLNLNTRESEFD